MRKMGSLRKHLPWTYRTFLVGTLAISGVPLLAGFFSKDAILGAAFEKSPVLWIVGLATAALTACYMLRLLCLTFLGKFRGTHEQEHHLHESPLSMTFPLIVLAIGSVLVGFLGIPEVLHGGDHFKEWLDPVVAGHSKVLSHSMEWVLMGVATMISVAGIGLAYVLYYGGFSGAVKSAHQSLRPLHTLLFNKYFVDEIYDFLIVRPLKFVAWLLWYVVDAFLIDKVLVQGWAVIINLFSKASRYLQSGDVQRYLVAVLAGTAGILYLSTTFIPRKALNFTVQQAGRDVTLQMGGGNAPLGLQYRVDWGDGTKFGAATTETSLKHSYSGKGSFKIAVEAVDPRWQTSSQTGDLLAPGPQTVRVE